MTDPRIETIRAFIAAPLDKFSGQRAGSALASLEAELTDLRMVKAAHDANVKMSDQAQAYYAAMRKAQAERDEAVAMFKSTAASELKYGAENAALRRERDEAVAALREATDALDGYGYEMRKVAARCRVVLPTIKTWEDDARLSNPKEPWEQPDPNLGERKEWYTNTTPPHMHDCEHGFDRTLCYCDDPDACRCID